MTTKARSIAKTIAAEIKARDIFVATSKEAYRAIVRDDVLRGLALVINRTSASWTYSYRPAGIETVETAPGTFITRRAANRHMKLGDISIMGVEEARSAAAAVKLSVIAKADPSAERKAAQKQREATARRATCEALLPSYELHLKTVTSRKTKKKLGKRHIEAELLNLRNMFAADSLAIGDLPPSEITIDHVLLITHPEKGAKGPAAQRHWHGALNRFLTWCVTQKRATTNVARDIPLPPALKSRDRWLTVDEIKAVWNATASLDPVYAAFVRWLMCVPCRRIEAATLRWGSIDMKTATWSQAAKDVKNNEAHQFHVHPVAMGVLHQRIEAAAARRQGETFKEALKRLTEDNELVFPSPREENEITGFSKLLKQVHKASGTSGWSFHDFRRTFASHMGDTSGHDVNVIDMVLNHKASATRGGVLGVYQRGQRQPAQEAAMKTWGNMLATFTGWTAPDATGSNVITFNAKGA